MNPNLRFLVVDDMPQMCKIIYSILGDLGWKDVTIATSGQAAIKMLQKKPFDIVLLDNNMPGMEGLDVLQQCRDLNIEPMPKFIMVTADAKRSVLTSAVTFGASDFITKPFKAQTLLDKVNRLFPG
jgi:two-component system chemotaxis response regulator CheY